MNVKRAIFYTNEKVPYTLLYTPKKNKPMNIVVFASGGGGNLKAAIDMSIKEPSLLHVGLVVTDRIGIKAIDIAKEYKIPVFGYEFERECGVWKDCQNNSKLKREYKECSIAFHDRIYDKLVALKKKTGQSFDLAVLSYHRWIYGKLLDYFSQRMINQHAGDLTRLTNTYPPKRELIGIDPVLLALEQGYTKTRTSTFLVRNNQDGGEILCQGPWVEYAGPKNTSKKSVWDHEVIQKKESDWPSLTFALRGIASGFFGITSRIKHSDGCFSLVYKGNVLPYGGIDLTTYGKN